MVPTKHTAMVSEFPFIKPYVPPSVEHIMVNRWNNGLVNGSTLSDFVGSYPNSRFVFFDANGKLVSDLAPRAKKLFGKPEYISVWDELQRLGEEARRIVWAIQLRGDGAVCIYKPLPGFANIMEWLDREEHTYYGPVLNDILQPTHNPIRLPQIDRFAVAEKMQVNKPADNELWEPREVPIEEHEWAFQYLLGIVEENVPSIMVRQHRMLESATCESLLEALGGPEKATMAIAHAYEYLKAAKHYEDFAFFIRPDANHAPRLFYARASLWGTWSLGTIWLDREEPIGRQWGMRFISPVPSK